MKKTLFLLLALPGIAAAVDAYTLVSKSITFKNDEEAIDSNTLTKINAGMVWDEEAVYNNWYMEFSLTKVTKMDYQATITAGDYGSGNANGLSVLAEKNETGYAITLGNATSALDGNKSLSFNTSDTITFAFFNGSAYLGIKSANNTVSDNYITCTPENITVAMTSGTSRAWTNTGTTQIGTTTIASLDSIKSALAENETLDMAKLMTTGVAVATLTETGTGEDNPAVTTPTYYKFTADNTIIWTDKADYSEDEPVSTTTKLPNYNYYSEAEKNTIKAGGDLTELKNRKFVLALGDSTKEGGEVVLDQFSISNGVVVVPNVQGDSNAKHPDEGGGSGYPSDDSNALPRTYSYGILEIAQGSDVVFSNSSGSKLYSYVGSLQMGEGAHMCLDGQYALSVTGLPYVSLEKNAQIKIQGLAQLKLGASHDNEEAWDSVILSGANKGVGMVTNKTDHTVQLGTETAKDAEFRNLVVRTTGNADMTIAAQMDNVYLYNSCNHGTGSVTVTGSKVKDSDSTRAIRAIRSGDYYSECGDLILLNRTEDVQLETLIIGKNSKVTTRTGDSASDAATVRIDAYNSSLAGTEFWLGDILFNGLRTCRGATLDSDLVLGLKDVEPDSGSAQQFVVFQPHMAVFSNGQTEDGYGLDMAGKNVTLVGNIVFSYNITTETIGDGMEILLFSNVGSLTLEGLELNEKYFYRDKEIAASTYFSTSANTTFTKVDAPTGEAGNMEGWFIEYRDNNKNDGTGDVYLTYNVISAASDNVPEPTTATLSLLALAALAARRRRK